MRASYDARTDTLSIILKVDAAVVESEDKPGVILDYDEDGNLCRWRSWMLPSGSRRRAGSSSRRWDEGAGSLSTARPNP
jgi:Protein of unknown function (DUF2283)